MKHKNFIKNAIIPILILVMVSSSLGVITTPTVVVSPDQTNHYAQYTITSDSRNNDLRPGEPDSIFIVFNTSTVVPSTISPSLVTVNGIAAAAVSVVGQRVAIATPLFIDKQVAFEVIFNSSANIRNPEAEGDYTLQAATSRLPDQALITSNTYHIYPSSSTVSAAGVTPNPSVEGENASYTIAFTTGSGGYLAASEGTITITFDDRITVPDGSISGVTVNGTGATATGNAGDKDVIITTPVTIDNDGAVDVIFALGAGLVNGVPAEDYTVEVHTSSETSDVTSEQFIISPADELSISAITSRPTIVNQNGEFEFDFRTGSLGSLDPGDHIYVTFPNNTFLPTSLSPSTILITSGGFSDNPGSTLVTEQPNGDITVEMTMPFAIGVSTDVTVNFSSSSGYLNPSIAGSNYKIQLYTDAESFPPDPPSESGL